MRARSKFAIILMTICVLLLYLACVQLRTRKRLRPSIRIARKEESTEPSVLQMPKHITKSLAQLGKMDEISRSIVFLNAVPNSGSEILGLLLKWLQGWNNFKHVKLRAEIGSSNKLSSLETEEFVFNTCDIIRDEAVPISFDRMLYFVNFTRYDRQSPTFINIIRDPADYVLSRFHQIMRSNGFELNTTTDIESCIMEQRNGCIFLNNRPYDLAIPYFCGQQSFCQHLNSDKALKLAQESVDRYYATLGIAEELNATLDVLEFKVPYFFKGATSLYYRTVLPTLQRQRNRGTSKATQTFKKHMRFILQKEYEFYEWAKSRLFQQLRGINGN